MQDKYNVLQIVLIVILLTGIVNGKMDSAEPALTEQILQDIEACMSRSPGEWSDEWRQEYLETIRKAVESHQDTSHYAMRLEILRKGFSTCWEGLRKTQDRSLLEVYRTRMRWYVEHLMGSKFLSEEERQKLRNQYTDIWDYAASSLLKQFPFLDPNAVQKAKTEDLNICYRKIDAPLMPVYLRPLPAEQVAQIKQRWDKLRYARVDLWRRLGGDSTTQSENGDAPSPKPERDYKLTKESLSQLLGLVWKVVPQRPDYYLEALENRSKVLKRRQQSKHNAHSNQRRLEKERSRQLLQVEHISFLMACLLETPRCFGEAPSNITQVQIPLGQQDKTAKGGGAYELNNVSKKK